MAISVVQTVHSNTATTTIASTGGGGTNTLVVCINSFKTSGTPSITSVTLGSTALTLAVDKIFSSSGEYGTWIYYLSGIAAGQTSVVISGTNLQLTSTNGGVCIFEVAGLAVSSALDKTNPNDGTTQAWSSGSTGTLSQPSEFVVGTANVDEPTLPSGWTNTDDAGDVWVAGYQIVNATTALTYNASQISAAPWTACVASFKGLSNVSVALPTAANTIAAFSPGIAAGPILLSTATVNLTAYPPSPSTATAVALTTAAVSVVALAPGLRAGPVSLTTASVAVSAPAPAARASVTLAVAAVSVVAYAVTPVIHKVVALPLARVTISAPPPAVTIQNPVLVFSIAANGGTDQWGNVYLPGFSSYSTNSTPQIITQIYDGNVVFLSPAYPDGVPAFVEGVPGGLFLSSGSETDETQAEIEILSATRSGTGNSVINLIAESVLVNGSPIG